MSDQFPDSISSASLQNLIDLRSKKPDVNLKGNTINESSMQTVLDIAEKHIDAAIDEYPSPMVHKMMTLMILHRMISWHQTEAEKKFQLKGCMPQLAHVLSDAAVLRAAAEFIAKVNVGEDDFTCNGDDDLAHL